MVECLCACASNWWPMFVLVFYALSPVPTLIARRFADSVEMSSVLIEICVFITSCIVVSAYGLPLVLARAGEVVCVIVRVHMSELLAYFSNIVTYLLLRGVDVCMSKHPALRPQHNPDRPHSQ